MCRGSLLLIAGAQILLAIPEPIAQETAAQADALAALVKIDGKATFDPAHPKRVIGIDI